MIILDDIVTTIDANHRGEIAHLLLDEFRDHQLVITTHDGIWYEQLVFCQRFYGMQHTFRNIEITRWDLDSGPQTKKYKVKWGRILEKLESCDKAGAGNECRTYLEWILKEICEKMKIPVVFKQNGRYTVAELLDPAESRMKKLLKESSFKKEVSEQFKKIRAVSFKGNLLSHDNPQMVNLSKNEVATYCHAVHNLHELFLCPKCKKFLYYFRDSKIVRCPDLWCDGFKPVKTR